MKALLREMVRLAKSPATIATIVLFVACGALLPRTTAPSSEARENTYYAISMNYSGGYEFNFVAYDGNAHVVAGAPVGMEFMKANGSGPALGNLSGSTNSRGFLTLGWEHPQCQCDMVLTLTGLTFYGALPYPLSSNLTPLRTFSVLSQGFLESRPSLLMVGFPDDAGTVPVGTALVACITDPGASPPPCTPLDLGAVTQLPQAYSLRDLGSPPDAANVEFNLVSQGGATLASYNSSYGAIDPTNPANAVVTSAGVSLQTLMPSMSFVVALGAGLVGYTAYARDRLNGSLDPVLALPTTRRRLILSRYAASISVVGVGAAASTFILAWTFSAELGSPFPVSVSLGLLGALVAEAAMFVGLAFLTAHLTRSSSLTLVGLILLVTLMTLLWDPLAVLTGRVLGLTASQATGSVAYLLNPAQSAVSLVGYSAFELDGGRPYLIATFTNPGLMACVVLGWVGAPIGAATVLFQYRD
ncbi:MAG TPA: ABC transporter permease [Thermoplasmata archaeon]|nr:ABC transporter permease [Thermoplasmata archaeon]